MVLFKCDLLCFWGCRFNCRNVLFSVPFMDLCLVDFVCIVCCGFAYLFVLVVVSCYMDVRFEC